MTDNERKEFLLDEITIFDWYDGIVRAIGASGERFYLLTLVAWDPDTDSRTFVMIDLEATVAREMIRLSDWKDPRFQEEEWGKLGEQLYQNSLTSYKGFVYCVAGEPEEGKEFSAVKVSVEHLKELVDYDVEQTMEPAAQEFWFNIK